MPRFVVLRHELPAGNPRAGVHWDFMLEHDGRLRTWALSREPNAASASDAVQLPDHRIDYLQYEGPVSAGRGDVSRWDQGSYQIAEETPDAVTVVLTGKRLVGRAELRRISHDALEDPQRWTFAFSPAD